MPWICLRTFENKWDLAATARAANEEELVKLQEQITHTDLDFLKDTLHHVSPSNERKDVVPVYRLTARRISTSSTLGGSPIV